MTKEQLAEAKTCYGFIETALEKALEATPDHIVRIIGVTALTRLEVLLDQAHGAGTRQRRRGRRKKTETQEGATT